MSSVSSAGCVHCYVQTPDHCVSSNGGLTPIPFHSINAFLRQMITSFFLFFLPARGIATPTVYHDSSIGQTRSHRRASQLSAELPSRCDIVSVVHYLSSFLCARYFFYQSMHILKRIFRCIVIIVPVLWTLTTLSLPLTKTVHSRNKDVQSVVAFFLFGFAAKILLSYIHTGNVHLLILRVHATYEMLYDASVGLLGLDCWQKKIDCHLCISQKVGQRYVVVVFYIL